MIRTGNFTRPAPSTFIKIYINSILFSINTQFTIPLINQINLSLIKFLLVFSISFPAFLRMFAISTNPNSSKHSLVS